LEVWKRSIELTKLVYQTTKEFPKEELYGITNQLRRSSVSIASNIAEGAARNSKNEFKQFLYFALGSLSELETQLIICKEINYITSEIFYKLENLFVEIRKMLLGLIKSVK